MESRLEATNRLYHDLAYLWPIISPPEEYLLEALYVRNALSDKLGAGRHRLLELGAGGGHNLSHLTSEFQCTAVDLSTDMLAISKSLNPGIEHHLGDMRTIRLDQSFDAVLIHDASSYLLTEEDLRDTFRTASYHLRSNGILLVEPDWVEETFPNGWTFAWERKKGDIKVKIEESMVDPDPSDSQVESTYTYTIQMDGVLSVERDIHVTGLFPTGTWTKLLEEAGFSVELRPLPPNEGGYGKWLFVSVWEPKNRP